MGPANPQYCSVSIYKYWKELRGPLSLLSTDDTYDTYVLYSLLGTSFRDDLVRVPPSILTKPVGKAEGKAGVLIRGRRLAVYLLSLLAKQKARQVFWSGVDGWDSAGDPPPMFYNK